jgi:hypothetical protein
VLIIAALLLIARADDSDAGGPPAASFRMAAPRRRLFTVANGVLLNVVMLFAGARRPLHDRLAGTTVQVVSSVVDRGRRSGSWVLRRRCRHCG